MTLLFGPPSSGKTTLLLALASKLDPDMKEELDQIKKMEKACKEQMLKV